MRFSVGIYPCAPIRQDARDQAACALIAAATSIADVSAARSPTRSATIEAPLTDEHQITVGASPKASRRALVTAGRRVTDKGFGIWRLA
jgi:hypothetical protein